MRWMDLITLNSKPCNCISLAEPLDQCVTIYSMHLFGNVQIDLTSRHTNHHSALYPKLI